MGQLVTIRGSGLWIRNANRLGGLRCKSVWQPLNSLDNGRIRHTAALAYGDQPVATPASFQGI